MWISNRGFCGPGNVDVYGDGLLGQFQYCFTSTETVRTIWDGEPRTATSTFTRLLSSDTPPDLLLLLKCCFTSTETVGLLGTGAQDVHLDFHTVPEL